MKRLRGDRRGIIGVILAVMVIFIVIIVVAALLLIPFRSTPVDEGREAAIGQGIEALQLIVDVDVGEVSIEFVDDADVAVALQVTGHHRSGLLGPQEPVNITWEERTEGDTLVVSSNITLGDSLIPFFSSDIDCTLLISDRLVTSLSVSAGVGGMEMVTSDGVRLTSVDLRVGTGGLRATMADNVTLDGPLRMQASTGGVDLTWSNVMVGSNASVSLSTSTGGVRATVTQTEDPGGNLTFSAAANTGGVDLGMTLAGNTSAHVASTTSLGGVSVEEKVGFNGTNNDLRSENYVGDSNFEVTLGTNTGGVNLRLRYTE
jgi:hypothetical protein